MTQARVLLISDDPEFARNLLAQWQSERDMPTFLVAPAEGEKLSDAVFDVAVLGPLRSERLERALTELAAMERAALYLHRDERRAATLRTRFPLLVCLREQENWTAAVVVLREMLRRVEASSRARAAERMAQTNQRDATLGRYLAASRHGFNNALTAVLGNAELILLEPRSVSDQVREQVRTIHGMALQMNEMMQRLVSLESELRIAEPDTTVSH